MRMTRRGVLAALFATLPLVTLTGCPSGGGEKTGGDAPAVATGGGGGKKLVIAWAKWDPADNLQKLTADFTKETGIAVEVNQIPWSDFETKINAAWTGKSAEFDHLKSALTAERGAIPYAALAAALNSNEGAARVAVHRLRKRYRELFRATVAETVAEPGEVDDEVRHLAGVLGGD